MLIQIRKKQAAEKCRTSVTYLSHRIKDLRQLKVNKESVLKKLQMQCEVDWRNSKYAMVISSLRSTIYKIENCIDDLLDVIERMCKYAAELENSRNV